MVKANDADGMVAGACHATADTLRPALQILKTAPGVKLVSGFFILDVPNCEYGEHGTFLFADCGLNQDPTAEELAAIADTSAKSFKTLVGAKPIIAMLSHSTKGSAKHPLVDKVVKAVEIAHEQYPGLTLDGELQTDAAIVPSVAKSKAPGSEVAGKANVLIFPEPGLRQYRLQAGTETGKGGSLWTNAAGYRKARKRPVQRLFLGRYRRSSSINCCSGTAHVTRASESACLHD